MLRVGQNIPTGVMPGPSWLALGVTELACGPGEALFRVAVLPQLSSVPGGVGGWCRADITSPACSGPLLAQAWASGLERGQPTAGLPLLLASKDRARVFSSTPTRMFYIF